MALGVALERDDFFAWANGQICNIEFVAFDGFVFGDVEVILMDGKPEGAGKAGDERLAVFAIVGEGDYAAFSHAIRNEDRARRELEHDARLGEARCIFGYSEAGGHSELTPVWLGNYLRRVGSRGRCIRGGELRVLGFGGESAAEAEDD